MMTEMEMNVAGDIMAWAMDNFKGIEELTTETMVKSYWKELLGTDDLAAQDYDGMEIIQ